MKWIWNNNIVLLNFGAGLIGIGFVFALFALVGFRSIFYTLAVGSTAAGLVSILCGLIIFSLQFGVRSAPKKVIACAIAVRSKFKCSTQRAPRITEGHRDNRQSKE